MTSSSEYKCSPLLGLLRNATQWHFQRERAERAKNNKGAAPEIRSRFGLQPLYSLLSLARSARWGLKNEATASFFDRPLLLASLFCLVFASAARADTPDPIEPLNRKIFWVNDTLDIHIVEPVARSYKEHVPKGVRKSVRNFFRNLGYPSYLVSDVLQLKFGQAGTHTARFLINSTVGVVGIFDVAKDLDLEHHEEDFGTALGYDGVGEGPYLMIPILGPSNVRDAVGRIVDAFLNPLYYLSETGMDQGTANATAVGLGAVDLLDQRSRVLEATDYGRENSVDYYTFIKSSYHQHRQGLIYDGNPPEEEDQSGEADNPAQDPLQNGP